MTKHFAPLLAAAALAATSLCSHAAPVYFTFKGTLTQAEADSWGARDGRPVPLSSPSSSLPAGTTASTAVGAAYAFTLGLDNGGSSTLGQTWTSDHVTSMTFSVPTNLADQPWVTTLRFGDGALARTHFTSVAGNLQTDAAGQVVSVFESLFFAANRFNRGVLAAQAAETNGPDIGGFHNFGIMPGSLAGAKSHIEFLFVSLPEAGFVQTDAELKGRWLDQRGNIKNPAAWQLQQATAVPEPGSLALVAGGLAALAFTARRRRA